MRKSRLLAAIFFLSLSCPAFSASISGKVVSISDGDTLTILDNSNTQTRVRLAAIDAPEKAQAFDQRGKQELSDICFGKQAMVEVVDIDGCGRSVGEVGPSSWRKESFILFFAFSPRNPFDIAVTFKDGQGGLGTGEINAPLLASFIRIFCATTHTESIKQFSP